MTLRSNKVDNLLEAITVLVNDNAPWAEKKKKLLSQAGETERTNLEEFLSWFEIEEK